MKRTPHGFTLVELMVAMVIFMIICAIAIPNYMSATQRAHEAVAVSFLRQVQTGEEAYHLNNQQYADTFAKLQPYISADLVMPEIPTPGLGFEFVSVAYAEPIPVPPPQGKSGSAPGQSGSNPGNSGSAPGQTGSTPGQGGANPGNSGSAPGQTGSTPGQGGAGPGSGSSGSGSSSTGPTGGGTSTADTKVYSMYIFQLTQTDPQHWSCTGEPIRDRLNSKFYYTDDSNVIRVSVGSLADALSPQI
ncbi:MAG: prepilin-type N-terminal cleavage/methylation domain-containing protein [Deltaproteobacteria bacterium]